MLCNVRWISLSNSIPKTVYLACRACRAESSSKSSTYLTIRSLNQYVKKDIRRRSCFTSRLDTHLPALASEHSYFSRPWPRTVPALPWSVDTHSSFSVGQNQLGCFINADSTLSVSDDGDEDRRSTNDFKSFILQQTKHCIISPSARIHFSYKQD